MNIIAKAQQKISSFFALARASLRVPQTKNTLITIGLLGVLIGLGLVVLTWRDKQQNTSLQSKEAENNSALSLNNSSPGSAVKPDTNAPTSPSTQAAQKVPGDIINLTNWRLTLPVDTSVQGNPDQIDQPELTSYSQSPYFILNSPQNAVIFRAAVDGVTTKNSKYPRSELREMTARGSREAAWSNSAGIHTMTIRQSITHLPAVKPEVVAGQIHDDSDDVIMVRLNRNKLYVEGDGKDIGTLDANYSLGRTFTVKLEARDGRIYVYYNGVQKVNLKKSGSDYYFKAGCYTQSNMSKGDSPSSYGEVMIYSLSVNHS